MRLLQLVTTRLLNVSSQFTEEICRLGSGFIHFTVFRCFINTDTDTEFTDTESTDKEYQPISYLLIQVLVL